MRSELDDGRSTEAAVRSGRGDAGSSELARAVAAPPQEDGWLARQVEAALDRYFAELDGVDAQDLYQLVLEEVERPLLRAVMARVAHNQSRAAGMLGLNRGTLRKKLKRHGLL